jgi:hypothetical protein
MEFFANDRFSYNIFITAELEGTGIQTLSTVYLHDQVSQSLMSPSSSSSSPLLTLLPSAITTCTLRLLLWREEAGTRIEVLEKGETMVALEVEEWDERQRRNCILKVKCHGAVIIFVF